MANPVTAVRNYFLQSSAELKKVAWPSREMTIRYSALVVAVSLALGAFFAALDFGLQAGVNAGLAARASVAAPATTPVVPDLENTDVQTTGDANTGIQVESEPVSTPNANGNITLPPIETPKQ